MDVSNLRSCRKCLPTDDEKNQDFKGRELFKFILSLRRVQIELVPKCIHLFINFSSPCISVHIYIYIIRIKRRS